MKTLCYLVAALSAGIALGAANPQEPAEVRLEEGFFLDGAEGVLEKDTAANKWNFRPSEAIELPRKNYPAGKPLPMLPCGILEQMVKLAGDESTLHVRLWAMATQYKHANYLYAVFFLPLKAAPPAEQTAPVEGQPSAASTPDDSIIPADILRQMKDDTAPDLNRFQQVAQVTGDMNLIGRSGYLQGEGKNKMFVPDAFGQNVERWQFELLPSAALEDAEKQMNKTPGRQRYTVSGLVTTFDGQTYMLLRRAQRTFTHGNFTP